MEPLVRKFSVIRAFLVHLGRFFRMLLLSVFVCVLLLPLAFNILEIIFGRFIKQDNVYLLCVVISISVSLIYTWGQKDRVNADEIIFFMRNRMIKQGRRFNHFLALNALLVAKVGNYDLELHIKKYREQLAKQPFAASKDLQCDPLVSEPLLSKLINEINFSKLDNLDKQAHLLAYSEALVFIESLVSSVGADDKQMGQIGKIYIETLLNNPKYEDELNYIKKISKRCGPYLCELVFVLLIRTLMNVNSFKLGYINYSVILEHPTIKKLGSALLNVDEEQINGNYYNRYFFLLNQEQVRIRQKWLYSQYQEPHCSTHQTTHTLSKREKAYITLGLNSSCSLEQVKRQYRKLVFKYHPDHIADYESFSPSQKQELNAQFLAIVQAYETILKDQA